jgi:hypothetical protein
VKKLSVIFLSILILTPLYANAANETYWERSQTELNANAKALKAATKARTKNNLTDIEIQHKSMQHSSFAGGIRGGAAISSLLIHGNKQ